MIGLYAVRPFAAIPMGFQVGASPWARILILVPLHLASSFLPFRLFTCDCPSIGSDKLEGLGSYFLYQELDDHGLSNLEELQVARQCVGGKSPLYDHQILQISTFRIQILSPSLASGRTIFGDISTSSLVRSHCVSSLRFLHVCYASPAFFSVLDQRTIPPSPSLCWFLACLVPSSVEDCGQVTCAVLSCRFLPFMSGQAISRKLLFEIHSLSEVFDSIFCISEAKSVLGGGVLVEGNWYKQEASRSKPEVAAG